MSVDRLLHDAEQADGGLYMANVMGDRDSARRLTEKRDKCIADALALDPTMKDEAWVEVDPIIVRLAKEATP